MSDPAHDTREARDRAAARRWLRRVPVLVLMLLLDKNPGVRTVLLTFSPIHLAAWQDLDLLGDTPQSRAQVVEYYPLFDVGLRATLPLLNGDLTPARLKYDLGVPFDLADDLQLYVQHSRGTLEPRQQRFWGGFTSVAGSHLGAGLVQRVVDKYFGTPGAPAAFSERAAQALLELIADTEARGVQLVLLDTPVPERFRAAHAALLDELSAPMPGEPASAELPQGALPPPTAPASEALPPGEGR